MFCTQCGTHLEADARFCTACGKPTAAPAAFPESPGMPFVPLPEAQPRTLRRNRAKKKIAGVCAGFADYFGMDVTLMRLIWIGLLIMPPSIGLIGYIVAWFVLPAD